jgi:hypothetical protein
MSENDEDFMSDNEIILFATIVCGLCSLSVWYFSILLFCYKKKPSTVSNTIILIGDIENQGSGGEPEQDPSQVNHINILDITDKNIDCSVCLDTDESDVIGLSLCGHKFHKNCIHNLTTCPMCRAIISKCTQQEL